MARFNVYFGFDSEQYIRYTVGLAFTTVGLAFTVGLALIVSSTFKMKTAPL